MKFGLLIFGWEFLPPSVSARASLAFDYDIQTTCPEIVEEYNLKKLRLGIWWLSEIITTSMDAVDTKVL
jgi:hypothetical protein